MDILSLLFSTTGAVGYVVMDVIWVSYEGDTAKWAREVEKGRL